MAIGLIDVQYYALIFPPQYSHLPPFPTRNVLVPPQCGHLIVVKPSELPPASVSLTLGVPCSSRVQSLKNLFLYQHPCFRDLVDIIIAHFYKPLLVCLSALFHRILSIQKNQSTFDRTNSQPLYKIFLKIRICYHDR